VTPPGNEIDFIGQIDATVSTGNNDILWDLLSSQNLEGAEESMAWDPEMQRGAVIHIEVPDQTFTPAFG
jgi:hypothetical protein